MTADEAIELTRAHIERQFPRACTRCKRRYATLAQYVQETTHVGEPQSYDAELEQVQVAAPIGTIALANCACGGTMGISSEGMSLLTYWRLMAWGWTECRRRHITFSELLAWVRSEVDRRTLADAAATKTAATGS